MALEHIDYHELAINPMTLFAEDWGLLTAGSADAGFNGMTIGWGHLGAIWDADREDGVRRCMPTAIVYVRPQRHTRAFIDAQDVFSIAFLPKGEDSRRALAYMGKASGRDGEAQKFAAAGLTPASDEATGAVYPAESELVFICKKLYNQDLAEEGFVDTGIIGRNYPNHDLHRLYVGEIVGVLQA